MPPIERLRVVVRPARSARRTTEVIRWIRTLLPAALLLVAPATALPDADDDADPDAITIDADDLVSGPLALADEILRHLDR